MPHFDTIVAPITGVQSAPVAIVRLSGPDSWLIAKSLMPSLPAEPQSHHAYYGKFSHGDDGLCILFAEGHSYTGEACAELNLHGSPASIRRVLALCYAAGSRPAEPGEFSQRAFLNGRLDLTQAEAVRDTIESQTDIQFRAATRVRNGALHVALDAIETDLYTILAEVEAVTDFAEEIGELDVEKCRYLLDQATIRIRKLLRDAQGSRMIREGLRVALVGAPNVGKSSLLNALVGFDRAIVAPIPGTTRDTIEEVVDLDGIMCRFIDTAGLRNTHDEVEQMGMHRTQQVADAADIVLFLSPLAMQIPEGHHWVQTKVDAYDPDPAAWVKTSAITGHGIDLLREKIRAFAMEQVAEDAISVQTRHVGLLADANHLIAEASTALEAQHPTDLLSTLLRGAIDSIGQINGKTTSEDMVERIFRDFCIGK